MFGLVLSFALGANFGVILMACMAEGKDSYDE